MDPETVVREIKRKNPNPPKYRAPRGVWVKPAWVVRRMVEREGWSVVSDAVRAVVAKLNLSPPERAIKGVRASYYEVIKHPWAAETPPPKEPKVQVPKEKGPSKSAVCAVRDMLTMEISRRGGREASQKELYPWARRVAAAKREKKPGILKEFSEAFNLK